MPRPFDWVSTFLYLAVLLVVTYFIQIDYCECDLYPFTLPILFTATISLIIIERIEAIRYINTPSRLTIITFLLLRFSLIYLITDYDPSGFAYFLFLLIPYSIFFAFGALASYFASITVLAVFLVTYWPHKEHSGVFVHELMDIFIFSFGLVFILAMAHIIQREKDGRQHTEKLLLELETSHHQLRAYAEQATELAVTKERNRVARDIHDSLGHYLTVINVQLEKALAFRQRQPDEAEQSVQEAKRLASEALRDVRQSVGTLRQTNKPFHFSQALIELVERVQNDALAVDLQIEGDETAFSRQTLLSLYRAAQEGLTNVQKHAQASSATVHIQLDDQQAHLQVSDNGQGFDINTVGERNFGLLGIRERLELIGGAMRLESAPKQGTHLHITAPRTSLALEGA